MYNNTLRGVNMANAILRLPAVKARTGLSRSTIYLRISAVNSQNPFHWVAVLSAGLKRKLIAG